MVSRKNQTLMTSPPRRKGDNGDSINIEMLVDYAGRAALRHRFYVTVVIAFSVTEGIGGRHIRKLLKGVVRESDVFMEQASRVVLLMNNTNEPEALSALARYRGRYNGQFDIRYALATYPGDIRIVPAEERSFGLLRIAERRMEIAKHGTFGEVVSAG